MWISWIINTGGVFGSVREIIETNNVLVDMGHRCTVYTPDGIDEGWLPHRGEFRKLVHARRDKTDVCFLVAMPRDEYFNAWLNCGAKIKAYCMMGYGNMDQLALDARDERMFLTKRHDYIVRNHWSVCDGSWQLRDMRRFNPEVGPAMGGVNLEQFRVMPEVKKRFDVVWSGDHRTRKDSGTVSKAIAGLSNASYFGRGLTQAQLPEFINNGRVFADAHVRGGWCNPVAEAIACGVVPVCTNGGFNEDFAHHGKTALLVDFGDHVTMRKHIDRLLKDHDLYNELRTNGLELIKQFDYKVVTPKLERAIHDKLNS